MTGALLFDKPQGWTSHDVVDAVRRTLPAGAKVGHTGTLDPLATGLLVLLVGAATRKQAEYQGFDKVYTGHIRLGTKTDTGDVTGKLLETKPVPPLTLSAVQAACDALHGVCEFPAPAYSAVKHKGKPLYKYARAGIEVPPKPRRCEVYSFQALSYAEGRIEHRLHCSSGTYVRSLAEAVGEKLGTVGTMETLRRERIGDFDVKDALSFEKFKTLSAAELVALIKP